MVIVTLGTERATPGRLIEVIKTHKPGWVIDTRTSPGSEGRTAGWGREELQEMLFGVAAYTRIRDLCCRTLPEALARGEAPLWVDLEKGLREMGSRMWRHQAILLLGAADNPMHDARGYLAEGLRNELSMVTVIHEPGARFTTAAPAQEALFG